MEGPLLGVALHPEPEFLLLAREAIERRAQLYEVSPEMHWLDPTRPSAGRAGLLESVRASGKPVVGHGLFASLGGLADPARFAALRELIRRDQAEFRFEHYSEHLGFTAHAGVEAVFPLPLPPSAATVAQVAARLRALPAPRVAYENPAGLAPLGDPSLEPELLRSLCAAADCGLVLDLHNAYTSCLNAGLELADYLARIPWERVVELHLSGGSQSEPGWVAAGARRRLDTHDARVPEPVWAAAERALEWAPGLRAVVVEWLGLREAQLSDYEADLARAAELLGRPRRARVPLAPEPRPLPSGPGPAETNPRVLAAALAPDPSAAWEELLSGPLDPALRACLAGVDRVGLELTGLIVKRLRFERILLGEGAQRASFERDPAAFTARFRAYDQAQPSRSPWPGEEAQAFRTWSAAHPEG